MKRINFLITLLICILTRVYGKEIEIKYNDGTDQPYNITYRTIDDAPGTVEVSKLSFWNGGMYEGAHYTVDVVEIPESIIINGQTFTVTAINTEYSWGSDYAGPKKIIIPSTVRWIRKGIRSNILEEIIIDNAPIEELYYINTFGYNENLRKVSFGNACVFSKLPWGCFENCSSLTYVQLPESLVAIDSEAFSGCLSLQSILLPSSLEYIDRAFIGCTSLEEVKYEGKCLGYIGYETFKNCESLTSISLPSVSYIAESAFLNCKNLSSVTINSENGAETRIGKHAFDNCVKLETLEYNPASLKEIGEGAFNNCASLKSFSLPSDCEYIGGKAFAGCSDLDSFEVIGDEGSFSSIDGVLIKDGYQLTAYPNGKKDAKYSVPESMTSIANGAFEGAVHLTDISFHDNVTDLGVMAFRDCKALKQVNLPESLNHIPSGTFSGCTSLEKVSIPDNYIYVGASSFQDCSALPEVKLPSELKVIGESAFTNCSKIESVDLPANVKEIRSGTFRNCESLKTITLPADLDTIRFAAFQGCKALKNIKLPESLKKLDDRAFKSCESIVNLTIPDKVTEVGINAFEDCSSLKEVKVGNGVQEIGQWAFINCINMEKLTLGSSLESIGAQAFDGDINIKEITCLSPEPPSFPGGFPEEVVENAVVIVPDGSEFAYNASPEWDPMVEGEVQKAESILLNFEEIELHTKESLRLTAEVLPADAVYKEVTWTSDDYYVAKVDENGIVTAKDYGIAVITATCGDVKANCIVNVIEPDGVGSLYFEIEEKIEIYDTNGRLLRSGVGKDFLDNLSPGLYIIRTGDKIQKFIVK